ncbi:hypothetical protein [Halocatena salina]|uniref:Uncharacterized protein n=1 Tax=Halocatena salina TaxID=2934340 RepID=A0A8U0ABN9_9EURY|nr:hypothetical protein [Halocatena salina]UPM45177.1 hypothetical protein MW046_17620 [Halocatena salina]
MAIDKPTIQTVNGIIAVYGLTVIAAVARVLRDEHTRPSPTPGEEYVPANPREKDIELS